MSEGGVPSPTPSRVSELAEALGRLRAKLKAAGQANAALVQERDAAVQAAEKAARDFDANALKAENDALRLQVRTTKHEAAFAKLARERGATEDTVAPLWKLSGWEIKADEPDLAAMAAGLDAAKGQPGTALLFGTVAAGNGAAPPKAAPPGGYPPRPGVQSGQGGPSGAASPYTIADESDPRRSDAQWQYQNWSSIQQAAMERMRRGEI
jgi:hypothetical protein